MMIDHPSMIKPVCPSARTRAAPVAPDTTLRPTALGTAKLAEARAIIARHETEATSALSPIERRLLLELLMKLHGSAQPD